MDRAKLEAEKQNYRFQKFIAGVGAALMLMKFIAWVITDSVSILTDALESIVTSSPASSECMLSILPCSLRTPTTPTGTGGWSSSPPRWRAA
ncbi:hypothetical protein [Candidatus Methanomethylophilus sp. 1R26]|uniref:hypothetical protein n=1 Tax=Candidatus Methanomethylophilus sp. 1R26 TaxID=1769296 RepID=UPI00138ED13E|nr:hypothetical protein [Candidatus Methanomethylophilus sp. 1R26]